MWHLRKQISLLIVLFSLVLFGTGWGQEITGTARWTGTVVLSEPVTIKSGATLTIAPGTRVTISDAATKLSVHGTLLVDGTEQAPVVFASPPGWEGIEFMEAPRGSRIRWAEFAGMKAALSSFATDFEVQHCTFVGGEFAIKLLRESSPVITDSVFADNQLGIDNEMKSAPTIRGNQFRGHTRTAILASHSSRGEISGNRFTGNKQAIGLLQRYPDRIANNEFQDNEAGIYCNQTQNTPLIENNHFARNKLALVNFSFAYPTLKNNRFVDNEIAIRYDQYGSPLVENNLFRGNGTALYNYRKSNPKVRHNNFERNDLAMFCDFSSYPQVQQNNFIDNQMAVKLGIYQSADWEKRSGSRTIMQREAQARQSQNPLLAQAPTTFTDIVDVSDNWWGQQTTLLEAAGNDGNVTIFHDRRDQPKVTYEGYGPESYRLDRVKFAPWLEAPVAGAGPLEAP